MNDKLGLVAGRALTVCGLNRVCSCITHFQPCEDQLVLVLGWLFHKFMHFGINDFHSILGPENTTYILLTFIRGAFFFDNNLRS